MDVVLRGADIRCEAAIHAQLANQLDLGENYGRNLHALHDRLSRDVPRPLHLVWRDARVSRSQLGPGSYDSFSALFREIEQEYAASGLVERFRFTAA